VRHSVYLTDDQWEIFQRLSKQKNPASFVRQVLDRYIRHVTTVSTTVSEPALAAHVEAAKVAQQRRESLDRRWLALGCQLRKFDDFNLARDWFITQYDSEYEALREIEERHAKEGLRIPRAWIYRHWTDAGSPGKSAPVKER
jgi:hypothetical protein